MKVTDLESIQESLDIIKTVSDKLDYNTSSAINKEIIKISPIISKEIERMDTEKITINSALLTTCLISGCLSV